MVLDGYQPAPERPAFELFYRRHMPAVMSYVNRHISSREDAEDLLVEVFTAALEQHEKLGRFSDQEQFRWLWRVAHNKIVDFYRRTKRRPARPLEPQDAELYEDPALTPEQTVLLQEECTWLRLHLGRLSQPQQEILRLHFVAGLRCIEIAQLLNKSSGAVRMLLTRALRSLRSIYEQQREEKHR